MRRAVVCAAALSAACAAARRAPPARVDLRVCVAEEALVEAWARHFASAVAGPARGGRDCDFTAAAPSALNAGQVSLRSAYDGAELVVLEGPVDLVPRLAALSLAPGTAPHERLRAQREKSGFGR